ncbi:ATP-dependent DNA helicase chl1 [Elasticomyces elasticus]|nr:ATP-dependent DNA helicase chl1 [Elasticomyces elasticus]
MAPEMLADDRVREFYHPYQPYDIQKQFMAAVYHCIEDGKYELMLTMARHEHSMCVRIMLAKRILRSASRNTLLNTFCVARGGKSLSLICGSLTWLLDHKRQAFEVCVVEGDTDEEPEWMHEHVQQEKRRIALQKQEELSTRLAAIRAKEKKVKERHEAGAPPPKRRKVTEAGSAKSENNENIQFVLDDYESDSGFVETPEKGGIVDNGLSAETQALMKRLGMPISGTGGGEELEPRDELKILFCSRTHSQLTQFVGELRRLKLPPVVLPDHTAVKETMADMLYEEVKHLSLGSRKNLCINPKVTKLGSTTAINERCLEIQQPGTSADHKCRYLPSKETESLVHSFRDHALAKIRDIEDLGILGKRFGICPYYASRSAIKPSEVVTLPYPLLLQKSAREALDISLKDHVVIFDEAHNLIDAITGIYSISVSLSQLERSRAQLRMYLQKFRNSLKGKNRVYVTQVVRLLDSLIAYLVSKRTHGQAYDSVAQFGDLMAGNGVDQINLYKLMHYLQKSKLARKVDGYVMLAQQEELAQEGQDGRRRRTGALASDTIRGMPVLTHIQGFIHALTNPSAEGRFFCTCDDAGLEVELKYTLLDPSQHFEEVVAEARAVILAGGTMSPMEDYISHLLPSVPPSRIMTLSCDHVIPASNLFVNPIVQTKSSQYFDFTFTQRKSPTMICNLGDTLVRLLPHIPDGVVVFFPSYAYLESVRSIWQTSRTSVCTTSTIWDRMQNIKPIFVEPRSTAQPSSAVGADVLSAYSATVCASSSHQGALLLSVIGGKLSEGINFSDHLGRCVIVIGLPYPNPHSAEWKAKMEYVEGKAVAQGRQRGVASREYAENVCMRAVNQAIGRAVRHKGDWAALLLVDRRYSGERIISKLPAWIKKSLPRIAPESCTLGVVERGLKEFFERKGTISE